MMTGISRTFETQEELLTYVKLMLNSFKIFTLDIDNLTLFISYKNND